MRDLTPEQVGKLYTGLTALGLSSRTVRYASTLLKAALNAAVRDGKLGRNPAAYVTAPRQVAVREKATWSAGQLRDFLASAQASPL